MAERQLPKLKAGVRFPSPAPQFVLNLNGTNEVQDYLCLENAIFLFGHAKQFPDKIERIVCWPRGGRSIVAKFRV